MLMRACMLMLMRADPDARLQADLCRIIELVGAIRSLTPPAAVAAPQPRFRALPKSVAEWLSGGAHYRRAKRNGSIASLI